MSNARTMRMARERKANILFKKPAGKFERIDLASRWHPEWMTRAYQNNRYVVMIDDCAKTTKGIAIKAMIQRHDDQPIPNHWAELQSIKNELFGTETTGIEFYPPESELVNDHNIYWLWIFPSDVIPVPIFTEGIQQ